MDRRAIIRNVFFSAYGVAVGAGYVAIMHLMAPEDRAVIFFWGLFIPAFFGLMGWGAANNSELSNVQRLVFVPIIPVIFLAGSIGMVVFLMIVVVMWPIALVGGMKQERTFRNLMKSKDRFLDAVDLRPRLDAGEGTLIEETGHKGPYRVWWIDENVFEKGIPVSTDKESLAVLQGKDHPFNSQCLKEYLDPAIGRAFLTSLPPKSVKSSKFIRMYPRMTVVMVVSPFLTKLNGK